MKIASLSVIPTNIPHGKRRKKTFGSNVNFVSIPTNDVDKFSKKK